MKISPVNTVLVLFLLAAFLLVSEAADKDKQMGRNQRKKDDAKKTNSPEKSRSKLGKINPMKASSSHQAKKSNDDNVSTVPSAGATIGSPTQLDQAKQHPSKQPKLGFFGKFKRSNSKQQGHRTRSGDQEPSFRSPLRSLSPRQRAPSVHWSQQYHAKDDIPFGASASTFAVSQPIAIPVTSASSSTFLSGSSSASLSFPLHFRARMGSEVSRGSRGSGGSGGSRGSRGRRGRSLSFSSSRSTQSNEKTQRQCRQIARKFIGQSHKGLDKINWAPKSWENQILKSFFDTFVRLRQLLIQRLQSFRRDLHFQNFREFLLTLFLKAAEGHLHCKQHYEKLLVRNQHCSNPQASLDQTKQLMHFEQKIFQEVKVILGQLGIIQSQINGLKAKLTTSVKSQSSSGITTKENQQKDLFQLYLEQMDMSGEQKLLSLPPLQSQPQQPCLTEPDLPCKPPQPLFYGGQEFSKLLALHPEMLAQSPPTSPSSRKPSKSFGSQPGSPINSIGGSSFPSLGGVKTKVSIHSQSQENIYAIDQTRSASSQFISPSISPKHSSERLYAIGGIQSMQLPQLPTPRVEGTFSLTKSQELTSFDEEIYESMRFPSSPLHTSTKEQSIYQNDPSPENPYSSPSSIPLGLLPQAIYEQIPQAIYEQIPQVRLHRSESVASGIYAQMEEDIPRPTSLMLDSPDQTRKKSLSGSTPTSPIEIKPRRVSHQPTLGNSPSNFVLPQSVCSNSPTWKKESLTRFSFLGARPKVRPIVVGGSKKKKSTKLSVQPRQLDEVDRAEVKQESKKLIRSPNLNALVSRIRKKSESKDGDEKDHKRPDKITSHSSRSLPKQFTQKQRQTEFMSRDSKASSLQRNSETVPPRQSIVKTLSFRVKGDAQSRKKVEKRQQKPKGSLIGLFQKGFSRRSFREKNNQRPSPPNSGSQKTTSLVQEGSTQDKSQKQQQTPPSPRKYSKQELLQSGVRGQGQSPVSSLVRSQNQQLSGIGQPFYQEAAAHPRSLTPTLKKCLLQPVKPQARSWSGSTQISKLNVNKP